ncbi:MAG: hypothetical protein V4662_04535 [Verrucomicrobiota bacterium]
MRRRLHSGNQDSLELLLDTLCNVFGGIILIACLLAMLSRPKPSTESTTKETDKLAGILEEKKIEQARAELDGLQKLRARLQREDAPSLRPLMKELQALKKTAAEKRQKKAEQDELAGKKAEQILRDASTEIARLRQQEQELERRLGVVNKNTEAARQRHAALENQTSDLQLELENASTPKIEKLRFPRERLADKPPAPLILRYGQIFPLYNADGSETPMLKQVKTPDGNFTAMPMQGQGFGPVRDAKRLREFLPRLLGKDRYLTIYLYPDSYASFRELKKLIFELGLDYGLEICTEHRVLTFNAKGSKPAPL